MPVVSDPANLLRLTDAAYADGLSEMADGADPVGVSRIVFDQEGDIPNAQGLSTLFVSWGQFLDHDLDLTRDNSGELIEVEGLVGAFDRSAFDPETGIDGPREQVNEVTPEIDASQIYGSTSTRTDALRTFEGGKLGMSADPTSDFGLLDLASDELFMAGNNDPENPLFASGDIRANENTGLTMMHTLIQREHNYWADRLAADHPDWTDEQLFQASRSIVEAVIQKITYQDWLPKLIGSALGAYAGHDPEANGQIATEFSTAAFRFGHTMVSSTVERVEEDGSTHENGHLRVQDAFFNVDPIKQDGIAALLRGQAGQKAQQFDTKVIDDLNFFLASPSGVVGFSLPALNILRGRDHGIGTYLEVRAQLLGDIDLEAVDPTDFSVITSNAGVQAELSAAYESVHDVDLWVGGLAEDRIEGTQMGAVFTHILVDQFTRTRAADETFGQLDPAIGAEIAAEIAETSLSDIILRNSNVEYLQEDVFQAYRRVGPDEWVTWTEDSLLVVGDERGNVLRGSFGDDAIFGDEGNDLIYGRRGDDDLFGGDGVDLLRGGRGDDMLDGGLGNDYLKGDGGDDRIFGDEGDDLLCGGVGDDDLFGGSGNDRLMGNWGNDNMSGGAGNDLLFGGFGNDVIDGGAGRDSAWGGLGSDTFMFGTGDERMVIRDFRQGEDKLDLRGLGITSFEQFETSAQQGFFRVEVEVGEDHLTIRNAFLWQFDESDFIFA